MPGSACPSFSPQNLPQQQPFHAQAERRPATYGNVFHAPPPLPQRPLDRRPCGASRYQPRLDHCVFYAANGCPLAKMTALNPFYLAGELPAADLSVDLARELPASPTGATATARKAAERKAAERSTTTTAAKKATTKSTWAGKLAGASKKREALLFPWQPMMSHRAAVAQKPEQPGRGTTGGKDGGSGIGAGNQADAATGSVPRSVKSSVDSDESVQSAESAFSDDSDIASVDNDDGDDNDHDDKDEENEEDKEDDEDDDVVGGLWLRSLLGRLLEAGGEMLLREGERRPGDKGQSTGHEGQFGGGGGSGGGGGNPHVAALFARPDPLLAAALRDHFSQVQPREPFKEGPAGRWDGVALVQGRAQGGVIG